MSHFYGTLQESRGEATRCGTKSSGLVATAASFEGAVSAYVYVGDDGRDWVTIRFTKWQGSGRDLTLYSGPVNPQDSEIFAAMIAHAPSAMTVTE